MALGLALLAACVPAHSAYLAIPIRTVSGEDLTCAQIDVSLERLREVAPDLDLARVAVFAQGREPLALRFVDQDGDRQPDLLRTWAPVRADGTSKLQLVSPGEAGDAQPPAEPVLDAVRIEWLSVTR